MPETLGAVAGPANLLCHYHDEKLWNLNAIQIRGRLEKRGGDWVFVTTKFTPPSRWPLWDSWWACGDRPRNISTSADSAGPR